VRPLYPDEQLRVKLRVRMV